MAADRRIPKHIAIVMDGNGRWANRRFLPRVAGHKQGVDALHECVKACAERGVKVLTVFAFSSEN
jgi:undecaprenyl diphosphate synthase